MNILYQSDDNYAPYMGVSIYSLLKNNENVEELTIYIINDSISQDNLNKIEELVRCYERKMILIDPSTLLNNESIASVFGCTGKRWNTHSYLKLLFARLIKDDISQILYIDCDTIISDDLLKVFEEPIGSCSIGMVQDSLTTYSKVSVGLTDIDRYYNSGVILFDVDHWKKNRCEERILEHLKTVRLYGTIDQDVLNVVLKDEIFTLPIRYNLQPVYLDYTLKQYNSVYKHIEPYYNNTEIEQALSSPAIYHFLRYLGQSPWHKNSIHPCREIFDQYLKLSPWKNMPKKEGKNDIAFRIERFLYKLLPKRVFLMLFHTYHERMIVKSNIATSNRKQYQSRKNSLS